MRTAILLAALAAVAVPGTKGSEGTGGQDIAAALARLDAGYTEKLRDLRERRIEEVAKELREALDAEDLGRAFAASDALDSALDDLHEPRFVSDAPAGRLQILSARWGMGTRWMDVTERVRGMVAKDRLDVFVTYRTLGDPAPHWKKTLFVVHARDGRIGVSVGAEDHRLRID